MPDKKLLITCLTALLLTGCSPAPSMVVFGASFPDWLRTPEKRAWLAPQLLTYPALTALIAMLTWLLVFPH